MKSAQKYANHPLLPLMQLLDSIETHDEFFGRQVEILEAIHLASPILKDRTPECCRLAKGPFFKRTGAPCTSFLMARFVESRIKETLSLISCPKKSSSAKISSKRSQSLQASDDNSTRRITMTFCQLRDSLPAILRIPTLGGRSEIEIHNPAGGFLTVINSKGSRYFITEADWNNACVIRSSQNLNPWASKHYTNPSSFMSYGLTHAAALLRCMEQDKDFKFDASQLPRNVA